VLSRLTILFRAFSAFLDLTLTLTWGVAPGYYISRRWRWFADFCSKAHPINESIYLRKLSTTETESGRV